VAKCRKILDAVKRTNGTCQVLFNYRYNPAHWKVEELIAGGKIGNVKSVHFEWLLDTVHGADYFRRWHRYKDRSGGLMVHKSSHHVSKESMLY
jgi:predicted dehydrogenase